MRYLLHRLLSAGSYVARWDGKNDSGRPAESGIYIARLSIAGKLQTGKMALIRYAAR